MPVSQDTKFEDRNGGIMDVQEGYGEIVKRSAGSIVRLVRSSRSRETRYMYSFARLYNVSWEGSLDCLLAYTLPLCMCTCAPVNVVCMCVYVCMCIQPQAIVHSGQELSPSERRQRAEQNRRNIDISTLFTLDTVVKGKPFLPKCSLIHEILIFICV